jgi:exodeoxyribonuclease VII small subunit
MTSPSRPVDQLNYEDAMRELEEIIDQLETAQSSLQESLDLFERGQALAVRCAALLDQAELRVRQVAVEEDAEEG